MSQCPHRVRDMEIIDELKRQTRCNACGEIFVESEKNFNLLKKIKGIIKLGEMIQ